MLRAIVVVGALALGVSAVVAQQDVAVQQNNLMKSQSKNLYGVLLRISRGQAPYDQAAIDAALTQLQDSTGQIAAVFTPNPKEDVTNATYGASQKIWQNKADFDSKIPPVVKAITDAKSSIKDLDSLKVGYEAINTACNACHETYRVKLK